MPAKSRDNGGGNGVEQWLTVQLQTDGVVTSSYTTRFRVAVNWRRQNWNTIAGWKGLLASQGFLPTQTYTDEQRVAKPSSSGGRVRLRLKADPRKEVHVLGYHTPVPAYNWLVPPFDDNALIDAKNSALNKARRMRVNLAVSVAEGRSTFRMLGDTVRTLGESYGHFRKGRWKSAARRLGIDAPPKSFANNWLAYQLGWVPLVSDAVGLVQLHRDQFSTERDNRFIVRGKGTIMRTGRQVYSNYLVTSNHGLGHYLDRHVGRAGMLLEVTSKLDQLKASVGLSAGDILSTVWELVPFSFVFDYFVNVGQWLGNLNALSGLRVLDSWQIKEVDRTTTFMASKGPGSLYDSNLGERLLYDRVFNRSFWQTGTLTWPRTRSITDQSAVRLTTLSALFRNQFAGDPKIGKFRPSLTE